MINNIKLRYFKCFENLDLALKPLTLLSGLNASGKSTVLQSLVLINQTFLEQEWSKYLMLNGNIIKLGRVKDIVDEINQELTKKGKRKIEIGLSDNNTNLYWVFSGDVSDMSMSVEKVVYNDNIYTDIVDLWHLFPLSKYQDSPLECTKLLERISRLSYISSERIGPRDYYVLEDMLTAPVVGPRGEHTLSVLSRIFKEDIRKSFRCEDEEVPTGEKQVNAWMNLFFPGCHIVTDTIQRTNAVTMGIRISDETSHYRPVHVGFGITQVLPIVVAAVAAKKDDILLIENPEIHLHPAGQVIMGEFLAEVANSGTQVIVETHSDHVLNGIRRAVKAEKLNADDAQLYFFQPRSEDIEQVVNPKMDSAGDIDDWPNGFFDQFDKDMNHFAGWDE